MVVSNDNIFMDFYCQYAHLNKKNILLLVMEALPKEILCIISNYLKPVDFLRVSSTNKEIYLKLNNDSLYWKLKILFDYKREPHKKISNLEYYKILYKTLCFFCNTKTVTKHKFTNQRTCKDCQNKIPELMMLSMTKAKSEFCLNETDLSELQYKNCFNYYNRSYNTRLYLLSDLKRISIKKYGSNTNLMSIKTQKKNNRFAKTLRYLLKYNILRSIMLVNFDIDITLFSQHINRYSEGIFSKYILNIGAKQNNSLSDEIINICCEIKFIIDKNMPISVFNRNDFDSFLIDIFLTHKNTEHSRFPHIQAKINVLIEFYKDEFKRKKQIELLFNSNKNLNEYKLYSNDILRYIRYSEGDPYEILVDHIEVEFISNSLNFQDFFCNFLSTDQNLLRNKYKKFIKKKYKENIEIPEELIRRYNLLSTT